MFEFIEETVKFLVFGVGLGYIARKFVGEYLIRVGRRYMLKSERNLAIVAHYKHQSEGKGHSSASVLDCSEGKCQVFHRGQLQTLSV